MAESNHEGPAHSARRQAIRRRPEGQRGSLLQRLAHWSRTRHGAASPVNWRREHWILAGSAALVVLVTAIIIPTWASARGTPPQGPQQTIALTMPPLPATTNAAAQAMATWHIVTVQPGQTLSDIFQSQGLGFGDLQRVLDASKHADALRFIHPGDRFAFQLDADGRFQALRYNSDDSHRVVLRVNGDQLTRTVEARDIERRQGIAHGVITSSLFGAGAKAGLSEAMIVKLADVFKFDIDFIKDIRRGDRFTVIYDEVYRDGQHLHNGEIIAAEFYNQGKRYTAYRFQKPDGSFGYYSEDGRPLQKALLRTPVKFTRISSRFSLARRHPILGYTRAHKGVDYAAPRGTPIHAAGSGVITYRGWARGFGRFIKIRHSRKYTTAYGHMSRFAGGLHVGSHVRQGQVIGYVGMSGLATGPHLHYEVRVFGHQRNPLTVTMPKPKPLPRTLLAQFKQQIAPMLARIHTVDANIKLASAAGTDGNAG